MSKTAIVEIRGREVIDSRGNPTVEVDVLLEGGVVIVTADDEPLIGPITEEALRAEAEADRGGAAQT